MQEMQETQFPFLGQEDLLEKEMATHSSIGMCVCSVMSISLQPHGLEPTRLLCPWNFQARILKWVSQVVY